MKHNVSPTYGKGNKLTSMLCTKKSACTTKLKRKSATNLLMFGIGLGFPLRTLYAALAMSANHKELTILLNKKMGNTHIIPNIIESIDCNQPHIVFKSCELSP